MEKAEKRDEPRPQSSTLLGLSGSVTIWAIGGCVGKLESRRQGGAWRGSAEGHSGPSLEKVFKE